MVAMETRRAARFRTDDDKMLPATPREVFDALPSLPGLRTEIIDGRLIVSPVGTPEHADKAVLLFRALLPLMDENDWRLYPGNVDVCIGGSRDPVEPDLVVAPANCPRWGHRELLSSGLKMVAEVVSPGSTVDDRERKPGIYARGGVPVYLLIDPVATPASVTVYSEPVDGCYQTSSTVVMGGELHIPKPIDMPLTTSIFL
jgi:Uma2 family endonuclease